MRQALPKPILLPVIWLIALLLAAPLAQAQEGHMQVLKLQGSSVSLPANGTGFHELVRQYAKEPSQWILQFQKLPNRAEQEQLQNAGIRLLAYLGNQCYVAWVQPDIVGATPLLRSAVPMEAAWKVSTTLAESLRSTSPVSVVVSCVPGTTEQQLQQVLEDLDGKLDGRALKNAGLYQCTLPGTKIQSLAAWQGLAAISAADEPVPLNLQSGRATKANVAQASAASGGYQLLGDSIAVGVGDNTSALYHIDTRDRVTNFNFFPYSNHGQHTNGTAGGAGIVDPAALGFAPHVSLLDHAYTNVWTQTREMESFYNMSVTNNSYANVVGSCTAAGTYDLYSQYLDSVTLNYPNVLHVFAAGNDGNMTCSPYPAGFGTVCGGFQTSKNVLVVANSAKNYVIASGSSKGPVKDGRLRPEISAIGSSVYSTIGNNSYLSAGGTSMASPQVTGGTALLQQHYKRLHSGTYPTAVLTKALLMNGALDLGNAGPDYKYGYGMMDLQRSLAMIDSAHWATGSISNGNNQTPVSITVPANTAQLKVMLVWADPPASTSASTQLVNDLDLKVTDPASTVHLPLVLTPSNPNAVAAASADHLNNSEQVVISNPASGSYSVGVSGYSVPFGPQSYVVVYDIVPKGIVITSPFKDGAYKANDASNSLGIYWTADASSNTFTIEYSTNNGSTWTTLSGSVPASDRYYNWTPSSGINSAQCLLRITRNVSLETATVGPFTINDQPTLSLSSSQCPGYVNLQWTSVTNATSYQIYRKLGYYMQPVATTTSTSYNAPGLRLDSIYYYAVAPVFGSVTGYRSVAVWRQPNSGTCVGSYSDNDLMLDSFTAPGIGRENTSTALSNSQTVTVRVRNLDDASVSSYKVSLQVNGGSWQSQTLSSLAANSSALVSFTGLNLATVGSYVLRAAIENLSATDPVSSNDTLQTTIRQLPNTALNLGSGAFSEDFESLPVLTFLRDTIGFGTNSRWDFLDDNDTGRLRSFVDDEVSIGGSRSVSLDMELQPAGSPAYNRLLGTFNLSSYGSSSEIRLEFDYRLHGKPKSADSNKVFIRGSDSQPWVELMAYDLTALAGDVKHSSSLSLTDALNAASQSFSSSTQIAFGQRDTGVIAAFDNANGITLDNISIYLVAKDVGLTAVTAPDAVNCGMSSSSTLTVTVFNGVNTAASNIGLRYQLDGGSIVQDTLASLAGKASTSFSFTQLMNTAAQGGHTVKVWVDYPGDDSPSNDTLYFNFRNEPLIASFPYLEGFESSDGYWWAEGQNSTWAWGTPASPHINKAASGSKAWKTNLSGYYHSNELSYLYSPCFDISSLTTPMLSFALNTEIENCGSTLCDGAWVEYSIGGGAWAKLGSNGQGTNWYNDASHQLWNLDTILRWRVASIPLPAASQPIRFRFVMSSDPGTEYEGLALDQVHVYDMSTPLYLGGNVGPISRTVSGSAYTDFTTSGEVLAQISAGNSSSLGTTSVQAYGHFSMAAPSGQQYYLPRSFVVHSQNLPTDSVSVRLYVPDSDVVRLVNATGCSGCSKPASAFELGVSKYDDSVSANENGSLTDNTHGQYIFIPAAQVGWVPFDAGYYAEFRVDSFSEFWFNNGGATGSFPLPIASIDFQAQKTGKNDATLSWQCFVDTQVGSYELQTSSDARSWTTLTTVSSVHDNSHRYQFTDHPNTAKSSAWYYRVKFTLLSNLDYFSQTRQLIFSGGKAAMQVYPNPVREQSCYLEWNTQPGVALDARLSDPSGRLVRAWSLTANDFWNRTELNLSGIQSGIYFLHVRIGEEGFDVKLVRY